MHGGVGRAGGRGLATFWINQQSLYSAASRLKGILCYNQPIVTFFAKTDLIKQMLSLLYLFILEAKYILQYWLSIINNLQFKLLVI